MSTENELVVPELSQEEYKGTLRAARFFVEMHETYVTFFPEAGIDYFLYPETPEEVAKVYDVFSNNDLTEIAHAWVHGSLAADLGSEFSQRAIGHFLASLTERKGNEIIPVLEKVGIAEDDPNFIAKATRFVELSNMLMLFPDKDWKGSGISMINHRRHFNQLIPDRRKAQDVRVEAEKRSALSLFAKGIFTNEFNNFFNLHQLEIILNEFDSSHTEALQAVLDEPNNPLLAQGSKHLKFLLHIALNGVQAREGKQEHVALLRIKPEYNLTANGYLHYFYSGLGKDEITNPELAEAMETALPEIIAKDILHQTLIARKRIHPDSHFADRLLESDFSADDMFQLMRTALDMHNGNLEEVDPVIRSLFVIKREGEISKEDCAAVINACIGFNIHLPTEIEQYMDPEQLNNFLTLGTVKHPRKTRTAFKEREVYPYNPLYRVMFEGINALPAQLRPVFEPPLTQEAADTLTSELLPKLYNEGYFRYFFYGTLLPAENFPAPPESEFERYLQTWNIVHPDIWAIIKQADPQVIKDFFNAELPDRKVYMEIQTDEKHHARREAPVTQCMPPDILDKLFSEPKRRSKLQDRLFWSTLNAPTKEEIATEKRIDSTDYIRNTLLPRAAKRKLPILTQIRLIHKAHMLGNEHYILNSSQANRFLSSNDLQELNRLGGIMRSPDRMPMNVTLANSLALCASFEKTPELMEQLAQAAEELFPVEGKNKTVTGHNIHTVVSAFQLYLALIHPFYESNGRTSEDAMHILYNRRPDLKKSVRYISSKGDREGQDVEERMNIINEYAQEIVRDIGIKLGLGALEAQGILDYRDLVSYLSKKYTISPKEVEELYLKHFDRLMEEGIDKLKNPKELSQDFYIRELSLHLRQCSREYSTKDRQHP